MSTTMPLRFLTLAALAVVLASVLVLPGSSRPRTAYAAVNCDIADTSVDSVEASLLTLINSYRAQNGSVALVLTAPLTRAASWHSTDMATKFRFDHVDSFGRDPNTRMSQCDVPNAALATENIAAGNQLAQETFDQWKNSAVHNAIMLAANARGIGISRVFLSGTTYGWYWTATFSPDASGGAPPAPGAVPAPPLPPAPVPGLLPPIPPCNNASLALAPNTTNLVPNSTVVLTASANCVTGNATYQWWGAYVFPNGFQSWAPLTAYSPNRTFTWTPTAPGNYFIGVWAKADGTSPSGGFDTSTQLAFTVGAPPTGPTPCSAASLAPPSTTLVNGQPVRFMANASCGGTRLIQWWGAFVFPNGYELWQPLTGYGAANTYDWTPSAPGRYLIGFWVMNQGTTPANGQFDTSAWNTYTVN